MLSFVGVGAVNFIIIFFLFFLVQKFSHREIQILLLIIFRNPTIAMALFSLLLLPGVFIHEISHLIAALILRVKVNKFSVVPKSLRNGQLRMGYVQTEKTDFFRDSLIGIAPLISGILLVALIANNQLGLEKVDFSLLTFKLDSLLSVLKSMAGQQDLGIWLYLSFCISSTMIPSAADRQSWKIIILGLAIIIIILVLFGTGKWLINTVSLQFDHWFFSIAFIIFISLIIHLLICIPLLVVRVFLSKFIGFQVISKQR